MRFRLLPRDGSATFQKIKSGRNWVGRVGPCEDGRFFGKIGATFVYAPTAVAAFDLVVARHLGFDSPAALDAHNRRVRQSNRSRRLNAEFEVNRLMRAMFSR